MGIPKYDSVIDSSNIAARTTVHRLLVEQLGRLYDAECHLAREIPSFVDITFASRLKTLLANWLIEIGMSRLELGQIAEQFNVTSLQGISRRMRSILAQERNQVERIKEASRCDSAAAAYAVQELDHLLTGYGAAGAYAEELGAFAVANELSAMTSMKEQRKKDFHALIEQQLRRDIHFPLLATYENF